MSCSSLICLLHQALRQQSSASACTKTLVKRLKEAMVEAALLVSTVTLRRHFLVSIVLLCFYSVHLSNHMPRIELFTKICNNSKIFYRFSCCSLINLVAVIVAVLSSSPRLLINPALSNLTVYHRERAPGTGSGSYCQNGLLRCN